MQYDINVVNLSADNKCSQAQHCSDMGSLVSLQALPPDQQPALMLFEIKAKQQPRHRFCLL